MKPVVVKRQGEQLASPAPAVAKTGVGYGLAAYVIWGLLPLYFMVLVPAAAPEIVAARILFSAIFCLILLAVTRQWSALVALVRQWRLTGALGLAAALIAVNWLVYIWAVLHQHTLEAALGYFINPLVSIVLGVLVLHERLRLMQWLAVALGTAAIVVLTVAYGSVPWISLVLAFSFGIYGFVKKRVGNSATAVLTLSVETLWLTPLSIATLLWLANAGSLTLFRDGGMHFTLMALSGIGTALPLILFGAAAARVPLSTLGLLQYAAPVLQFLVAIVVMKEQMPLERWIGFSLVWFALIIFSADLMVSSGRKRRRT